MKSKYEKLFTCKYPHANVRAADGRFAVYAGDYLCADGRTKREAFKMAWTWEQEGLITPDPREERASHDYVAALARAYTSNP